MAPQSYFHESSPSEAGTTFVDSLGRFGFSLVDSDSLRPVVDSSSVPMVNDSLRRSGLSLVDSDCLQPVIESSSVPIVNTTLGLSRLGDLGLVVPPTFSVVGNTRAPGMSSRVMSPDTQRCHPSVSGRRRRYDISAVTVGIMANIIPMCISTSASASQALIPVVSSKGVLPSAASTTVVPDVEFGEGACGGSPYPSIGLRPIERRVDLFTSFVVPTVAVDGNYSRVWSHYFAEVANRFPPDTSTIVIYNIVAHLMQDPSAHMVVMYLTLIESAQHVRRLALSPR